MTWFKLYFFFILLLCIPSFHLKGQMVSYHYTDTVLVSKVESADMDLLFQKARSLNEQENFQAAILVYQEILRIEPQNQTAHLELGGITFRRNNWAYSIALMEELTTLNPEDSESRRLLFEIYHTYTMDMKELKMVYELVQLNPTDTALLYRLSTLYEMNGMYPEHAEILESLIVLEPQKEEHYMQLADLYCVQLNNAWKGIKWYERLLEIQPNNIELLSLIASKYGELDEFGKQVMYYEKIHKLASDTVYWDEVLYRSYWKALKQYDHRFDVQEARNQCNSLVNQIGERDDLRAVSEGLATLAKPLINYRASWRRFDFSGETDQLKNTLTIGFLGPFPGSRVSVENNYLYIRQDYEPFDNEEDGSGELLTSQLYQGGVSFDQRFSKSKVHFNVGIVAPTSGLPDMNVNFSAAANYIYNIFSQFSVFASYDLSNLTTNPIVLNQNIRQQQLELGLQYLFMDDLNFYTSYQLSFLSDNNTGRNATIQLEYNLFETMFKSTDIEAKHPLGYDYTGTSLSVGVQYSYLDYATESQIYPTVLNEHQMTSFVRFEKQLIQSFIGRVEAYFGMNNYRNTIWGYSVALEKHISWRLNLFLQWEQYILPYSIDNTNYTNNEHLLQIGIISRF